MEDNKKLTQPATGAGAIEAKEEKKTSKKLKRKKISVILFTAILVLCGVAAVIFIGLNRTVPPEELEGEVDVTDYRVSSKVPGRILKFYVEEGDYVHKGDTLAILDIPDVEAKLAQADAAVAAAQSQSEKAQNGARQEQIQGAYEMWQKAIAGQTVAKQTYDRVQRLYDEGVMTGQKRDEARAQYDAAVATVKAAKAQYDMAVNGTRYEDKEGAAAQVQRARGAVKEVKSYVKESVLTASADGEVREIFPEVGELVCTGAPIMNIDTPNWWFTFNLREDYLPGLETGKEVNVYMPALNKTVKARITLIKDVGSFAVWKATKALDKYDLKTFEVKARPIENAQGVKAGMSAVLKK